MIQSELPTNALSIQGEKMENIALELQSQIKDFEFELSKLHLELKQLTHPKADPQLDSPGAIASAIRQSAKDTAEKQLVIRGIEDAIAELTSALQWRQQQLAALEKEQIREFRNRRVQEGREKIRAQIDEVENAAENLKTLFMHLRLLAAEYAEDFSAIYPATSGEITLNTAYLLNYGVLSIPKLTEESGRFNLSCIRFDPFQAEKDRHLQEVREKDAKIHREGAQTLVRLQLEKKQQEQRQQREKMTLQMEQKKSDLESLYMRRKELNSWGGNVNLDAINNSIGSLIKEIREIESEIHALDSNPVE